VSKKSYIDFGDNFNFGELVFLASLIVGELVCRRVVHKACSGPPSPKWPILCRVGR